MAQTHIYRKHRRRGKKWNVLLISEKISVRKEAKNIIEISRKNRNRDRDRNRNRHALIEKNENDPKYTA